MPELRPPSPTPRGTGWFRDIRRFDTVDSTNRVALEAARAGAPEGLVIVADFQTAGRGRLGRSWTAPPGASLLVSALVRPPVRLAGRVGLAAGLALAEAVEVVAGVRAALKWPNDLVVGGRKLAGILAEADLGSAEAAVVVGIGCNVNWDELPEDLAATATACNREAGRTVDREALLDTLLTRLEARVAALDGPTLLDDYRARLATIGRRVHVELPTGALNGVAVDLGADGELIVRDDSGKTTPVLAGDVVRLRPA
jgi:BirA family transcriptional regulator, biotin operon repressor / biotin---[acetyl-CoA-carboxylase] ligase